MDQDAASQSKGAEHAGAATLVQRGAHHQGDVRAGADQGDREHSGEHEQDVNLLHGGILQWERETGNRADQRWRSRVGGNP
ncbi:hypothetical protein D3C76_966600 [compost metagenome]